MVRASLALLASKLGSRAGSRLRLVKSPVTLTDAATNRIKELLAKRQKVTAGIVTEGLGLQSQLVAKGLICFRSISNWALSVVAATAWPIHSTTQVQRMLMTTGARISCFLQFLLRLYVTADEKGKFDELVEQNGVQVLIDSPALMHLFGTKIDFVTDRLRYVLVAACKTGYCTQVQAVSHITASCINQTFLQV